MFQSDYASSTPFHHMDNHQRLGTNHRQLLIRGHRIDVIYMGFHISQQMATCENIKDFIHFRDIMKFIISVGIKFHPHPGLAARHRAVGSALMTAMPSGPSESDHPFQQYIDQWALDTRLSNRKLANIWKTYQYQLLADSGIIWTKLGTSFLSLYTPEGKRINRTEDFKFNVKEQLTHSEQLAWRLHQYLSDVLQRHRFIITQSGYMGLAPPDTKPGDVVVVIGGPGTPFIIRDTSNTMFVELRARPYTPGVEAARGAHTQIVPSTRGTPMSELMGPCHLHGFMNGEMYGGMSSNGHDARFEWETDELGTIPKPTICLV